MGDNVRPEEIITEVYRQLVGQREEGEQPAGVLMSLSHYRLLNWYRCFLGESAEQRREYLKQYSIFGLDIRIDNSLRSPLVR